MKTIYISGPYTAETEGALKKNVQTVRVCAMILIRKGWCVIIPHQNFYKMDEYGIKYDTFMEMDIELLKRSDAIFLVSTWKASKGSVTEHDVAKSLGIRIFKQTEDGFPCPGDLRSKNV